MFKVLSFLLVVLFAPCVAWAQDETPQPFVVVLDLPSGETDALVSGLKGLDGVRVEGQTWFLEEVQARGITPRRILRRPKDMRWVMRGANITYVLFLEPKEGGFTANFVGETGETEEKMDFEGEKVGDEGLAKLVEKTKTLLKLDEKPKVAPVETLDEEEEIAPVVVKPPVVSGGKWLDIGIGFRLLKRDLVVGGKNGGVLTYPSQFYPGGQLSVEGYPGDADEAVGFTLRGLVGLGSVSSGGVASGVLHADVEGGVSYRVRSQLGNPESGRKMETKLRGGPRFTMFSTDAPALPATSLVALSVGGAVTLPVLADEFKFKGSVDLTPFGLWLEGKEQFGESAFTYGVSTSLGGVYAATSSIEIAFDYWLRVDRTAFSGPGALGFDGAETFEMVQGLYVGANLKL